MKRRGAADYKVSLLYFRNKYIDMTAIELKTVPIRRISEINDFSFLKAIITILDYKTDKEILTLNPKQREEIIASLK